MSARPRFVETEVGVWHDGIGCFIERLEIDFIRCRAALWLPPVNCTDMSGTIAFIEGIDRRINRIHTFGGQERDTTYIRADGKWYSVGFAARKEP